MPVRVSEKFIVFRTVRTPQGPAPKPVVIVEDERNAIQYIAQAQKEGAIGGWSYAKCPSREMRQHQVMAGRLDNYRIPTINDPNITR